MYKTLLVTSFAFSKNQSLADCALVMVSWVVKVLEAMINSVVSGFRLFTTSV